MFVTTDVPETNGPDGFCNRLLKTCPEASGSQDMETFHNGPSCVDVLDYEDEKLKSKNLCSQVEEPH